MHVHKNGCDNGSIVEMCVAMEVSHKCMWNLKFHRDVYDNGSFTHIFTLMEVSLKCGTKVLGLDNSLLDWIIRW